MTASLDVWKIAAKFKRWPNESIHSNGLFKKNFKPKVLKINAKFRKFLSSEGPCLANVQNLCLEYLRGIANSRLCSVSCTGRFFEDSDHPGAYCEVT